MAAESATSLASVRVIHLSLDLEDAEDTIISVPSIIPNWSQTIKEVVCGGMHALVLTADGRVFSFGCNDDGALGRP